MLKIWSAAAKNIGPQISKDADGMRDVAKLLSFTWSDIRGVCVLPCLNVGGLSQTFHK